jgi:carboxyl-terminal processing protease
MRRSLLIAASAFALLASPFSGAIAAEKNTADTYRLLNLFGDVFERIRNEYVEPVGDEELIEAAVNGMLQSLDPHSTYFNQKSYRDMQVQTRGEFGGLGLEVSQENGLVKVVAPIDDTPAQRAGLQPNDLISHIDGEPVAGLSLNEAVDRMRGPPNSQIRLTIRRESTEPFDVTLTRAVIRIQSVKAKPLENIGYIRITQFTEKTDAGLKSAVADLKKQIGKPLAGYILDLRNNPGGLLDQAVAVSDAFLERGEIVSTRSRKAEDTQRFNARAGDLAEGLPIVVLINDGSASASEIVAGALQDHRRAILLGTKSFGKGSVQSVIPLPGHGAIKLTTARYYTPSGRSIQQVGIEPDIKVSPARIENLAQAERRSEASLRNSLRNPNAPAPAVPQPPANGEQPQPVPEVAPPGPGSQAPGAGTPPGAASPTTPATAQTPQTPIKMGDPVSDYQLARALDLLRGLSLYRTQTPQ